MSYHDVESNLPQQIHVILTEICSVHNYRPQTKFAKVMFSRVSVCPRAGGGVSASGPRGWGGVYATPPWSDTPQWQTPPGQTPPRQTIPQADTPLPSGCWDTVNKRAVCIPLERILAMFLRIL